MALPNKQTSGVMASSPRSKYAAFWPFAGWPCEEAGVNYMIRDASGHVVGSVTSGWAVFAGDDHSRSGSRLVGSAGTVAGSRDYVVRNGPGPGNIVGTVATEIPGN